MEDGELVFTSSQDGWYEPVALGRVDGALLENGLRVGTRSTGGRYHLQFRQVQVVAAFFNAFMASMQADMKRAQIEKAKAEARRRWENLAQ